MSDKCLHCGKNEATIPLLVSKQKGGGFSYAIVYTVAHLDEERQRALGELSYPVCKPCYDAIVTEQVPPGVAQ